MDFYDPSLRRDTPNFLWYSTGHGDQQRCKVGWDSTSVKMLGGGDHWGPSWKLTTTVNDSFLNMLHQGLGHDQEFFQL